MFATMGDHAMEQVVVSVLMASMDSTASEDHVKDFVRMEELVLMDFVTVQLDTLANIALYEWKCVDQCRTQLSATTTGPV